MNSRPTDDRRPNEMLTLLHDGASLTRPGSPRRPILNQHQAHGAALFIRQAVRRFLLSFLISRANPTLSEGVR
ncbi:hypothetical protein DKG10_14790 [Salmonella enterica]|nr:hypothetical protein [Salmonella enterica]EBQ6117816.1 hypothetical protein [Salmonella enterica subsp. enterica serovar Praha]EAV4803015.1 hypothetical protein [Salmonella enterica]EBJ6122026.1 hypothetical protein [Salmonella enterica]EBO4025564.1 hypothetical protein [Salmonella enterica]